MQQIYCILKQAAGIDSEPTNSLFAIYKNRITAVKFCILENLFAGLDFRTTSVVWIRHCDRTTSNGGINSYFKLATDEQILANFEAAQRYLASARFSIWSRPEKAYYFTIQDYQIPRDYSDTRIPCMIGHSRGVEGESEQRLCNIFTDWVLCAQHVINANLDEGHQSSTWNIKYASRDKMIAEFKDYQERLFDKRDAMFDAGKMYWSMELVCFRMATSLCPYYNDCTVNRHAKSMCIL